MAFHNPKGRANYEPNSWGEGPREDPQRGFRSFEAPVEGVKLRARPERFADHYSQARQFYLSQTPVEQVHIRDAFVFELSKVETEAIRARMVAHLRVVDEDLAAGVAGGLGLALPPAAEPARAPVDLTPSPALSILGNAPGTFRGRKLGVLAADGADAGLLDALAAAAEAAGATVELVAPKVGGLTDSAGTLRPARQQLKGGPSVLYDAVALALSEAGAATLAREPAAREFVADAFAHGKFIAHTAGAKALFDAAGVAPDEGCVALGAGSDATAFLERCAELRHWAREAKDA